MKQKNKKYITIEDGYDFRTIAKMMTDNGYAMNHATARNVLLSAMHNLIFYSSNAAGNNLNENDIKEIMKEQNIHDALPDVLYLANEELKKE